MFLTNLTVPLFLRPGCVYDIVIPHDATNAYGYAPAHGTSDIDGIVAEYQNGFVVKNEEVGVIYKKYPDDVKIAYHHKLAMDNTVWFVSAIGHTVKFIVGIITPHDHASIATGGPAYGTYYTQIQSESESG